MYELYEYIRENGICCGVFQPLVDDNGIDYIIRKSNGEYTEIQIKGRTKKRPFTIKTDLKKHNNYWLILYYNGNRYILNKDDILKELKKGFHINTAPKTKKHEEYQNRDFGCLLK